MEETQSYLLTKHFAASVPVRFFFFNCCSFFTLMADRIYNFLTAAEKIFMLFFQRNSYPLFFISRASSFSVIHVGVNIQI